MDRSLITKDYRRNHIQSGRKDGATERAGPAPMCGGRKSAGISQLQGIPWRATGLSRKEALSEWLLFWIIFIPSNGVGVLEKYRLWRQQSWWLNSNPVTYWDPGRNYLNFWFLKISFWIHIFFCIQNSHFYLCPYTLARESHFGGIFPKMTQLSSQSAITKLLFKEQPALYKRH